MKHNVFTVHDSKAQAYLPPFYLPEIGMAIRVFSDCVNSADHQFGKHPSDYTLFDLGVFNDNTGLMVLFPSPSKLMNGVEAIRAPLVSVDAPPVDQLDFVKENESA